MALSPSRASGNDVPDVVAPPPHHPRFPLTVSLRGIPAIAIIVGHAWFFTGGFGGFTESLPNRAMVRMDGLVALFFLLSAFLLYRPFIAHRARGPAAPTVSAYGKRRFLRLYPAYWVALTLLAIAPGVYGAFSGNWWAFYSLTDFFDLRLHDVCPPNEEFRCGLPQSWTLGVDMSFYVLLPLWVGVTALIARGREPREWMRIELGLIAVAGLTSLILGGPPFDLREHDWFIYTALGHLFWFGLGLALAVVSVAYGYRDVDPLPRPLRAAAERPVLCWLAAAAIYVVTVFAFYPAPFIVAPFIDETTYLWLNVIQGAAAVLIFIPAVFGNPNRGAPARLLGQPWLLWVGLISYGLLLWNTTFAANLGYPGADEGYWTVLIAGSLLAVPLAALSYYLVERPLMRFKYRPIRELLRRS
ncbi:MAG TPA: acyltransferase [Solirubrobacterales bacterium]|nr:acyltransferase [Solirubrobacterales bacterium]